MRTPIAVGIAVALLAVAVPASAKDRAGFTDEQNKALDLYVQCWHSAQGQCGRNLVDDGLNKPGNPMPDRAQVLKFESALRNVIACADGCAPTATYVSTGTTSTDPTVTSGTGQYAIPSYIVMCESGGNYSAVNPNGHYGAYQFDQHSWDSYAPTGYQGVEPDQAPPSVQDQAAGAYYAAAGSSPWACG